MTLQANAVRTLSPSGDWTYGNSIPGYLQGDAATIQQISCRLKQIVGECFWDVTAGISWFTWLQSFDPKGLALASQTVLLNTPNVTKVYPTTFDLTTDRVFKVQWNVDTIYSKNLTGTSSFTIGG